MHVAVDHSPRVQRGVALQDAAAKLEQPAWPIGGGGLAKLGCDVSRSDPYWDVGLKDGQSIDMVLDLLRNRGLKLRHLAEKRQTLEDLFIQTVEAVEPGIDEPVRRRAPRE